MTYDLPITPLGVHEDATLSIPSTFSLAFSTLLGTVAEAIAAQRRVETVDDRHPAFDRWSQASEDSWAQVADTYMTLAETPALSAGDAPLQRLVGLIQHRIGVETPADLKDMQQRVAEAASWLVYPASDASAHRISGLMEQGRACLTDINTLTLFCPIDDAPRDPDMACSG